jgi:hypothetical protein
LPLGFVWPSTVGFEDFLATIQSLKSSYQGFVQVFEVLKPELMSWFQAIAQDPTPFMIPITSFLEVCDKGFPAVKTGFSLASFLIHWLSLLSRRGSMDTSGALRVIRYWPLAPFKHVKL